MKTPARKPNESARAYMNRLKKKGLTIGSTFEEFGPEHTKAVTEQKRK